MVNCEKNASRVPWSKNTDVYLIMRGVRGIWSSNTKNRSLTITQLFQLLNAGSVTKSRQFYTLVELRAWWYATSNYKVLHSIKIHNISELRDYGRELSMGNLKQSASLKRPCSVEKSDNTLLVPDLSLTTYLFTKPTAIDMSLANEHPASCLDSIIPSETHSLVSPWDIEEFIKIIDNGKGSTYITTSWFKKY